MRAVTYFRRHATGRAVIIAFVAMMAIIQLFNFVLFPAYRAVASGFDPFDVQFPLTQTMVAIQRGAFSPGIATAYLRFLSVDFVFPFVGAIFFALFWGWLMNKADHPMLDRWGRSGLLFVPFLSAFCDAAENVGFFKLVIADPRDPLFDLTETTLAIHRAKFLFINVNSAVTLVLIVVTAFAVYRRRKKV